MHQSWDNFYCHGYGPDPDLMRERLGMLEFEGTKSVFLFDQIDDPAITPAVDHGPLFECPCSRCVRLHTLTIQDGHFLSSIGITWMA